MNYVIDQAAVGRKHAGSKARDDVNSILEKRGFVRKTIECTYSADIRSILKDTFSVPRQAKQIIRSFEKDSFFVLQFPFRCFTAHLGAELCRIAHRRNGYAVALIHDLDALRCAENQRGFIEKTLRNEIAFLEYFDCIIAHNRKMKQYLAAHGIESNKIIELELFDYLVPENDTKMASFAKKITVAGNLHAQKAYYLHLLQNTPGKTYEVDLLGTNWEGSNNLNDVCFKGSFTPDEIASYINEGFGLVWDGDSLDGCTGDYGFYLHYNNPHKLSSYIACGIPVITWKEAAIAPFVIENEIGIAISSLQELNSFFDNITETSYNRMAQNVRAIRSKVVSGEYLNAAIDSAINLSCR